MYEKLTNLHPSMTLKYHLATRLFLSLNILYFQSRLIMSEIPTVGIADMQESQESQDLDDYSEDEEEPVDTSQLSWPGYFFHYTCVGGKKTLAVIDGMGEWLANFFGITGPKYWYIIEEYERQKAREERDRREGLQEAEQILEGGMSESAT